MCVYSASGTAIAMCIFCVQLTIIKLPAVWDAAEVEIQHVDFECHLC